MGLIDLIKQHSKGFKGFRSEADVPAEQAAKENEAETKPSIIDDPTTVAYHSMINNTENTSLYRLYKKYCDQSGMTVLSGQDFINEMLSETNKDGIFMSIEQKRGFLLNCLTDLHRVYSIYESEHDNAFDRFKDGLVANARQKALENGEDEDEAERLALENMVNPFAAFDSVIKCFSTPDDMVAYCIITPHLSDGAPFSREKLEAALAAANIVGNLDQSKIDDIVNSSKYFKFLRVAKGIAQIDGVDGSVEDLFPRNTSVLLQENSQGQVDYKDLGLFKPIKQGDVICKITKAVAGTDGITVKGRVIKAYQGKEPSVPNGEGTVFSEDGLQLLSSYDGFIAFENGKFVVKRHMLINGNVDSSTGNIIFNGDVEVKGDVLSGFTIDVAGNIKVFGVVEGAILKAGGDISLKGGVSGNNTARLTAGGIVKSLFLENCEVRCQGGVYTESIIQSEIYSDTIVDCMMGKGAIIGGNIYAQDAVMALVVGSKTGKLTNIYIGKSNRAAARQTELEALIKSEKLSYEKMVKNISFLESLGRIPPGKEDLYEQLKEQQLAYAKKIEADTYELNELIKNKTDYEKCFFKTGKLYEPVFLQIGPAGKKIPAGQAVYYKYSAEDADIVIAPYQ